MEFTLVPRGMNGPKIVPESIHLRIDHWNDQSFVTMFRMIVFDSQCNRIDIGDIKIGFFGQTSSIATYSELEKDFAYLSDKFFSLGQSVEFYKRIAMLDTFGMNILRSIRDVVENPKIIDAIANEEVFGISLLRDVSLSIIRGQFWRVLHKKAELTNFKFKYERTESEEIGPSKLEFNVIVGSKPNTNIHAIIGRNGVGKTTILNGMISAITDKNSLGKFYQMDGFIKKPINVDYFSSLVSVSFSAFDPFHPPVEQPDPSKGTCYFYIGLKDPTNPERHLTIPELRDDCIRALIKCFLNPGKTRRWITAVEKLGLGEEFSSVQPKALHETFSTLYSIENFNEQPDENLLFNRYKTLIESNLSGMSSGHAIVLLTITRLVAQVEEKTLVLMDEPESHLHPPLLSAFIRAIADLMQDRNGVAIIATHSPVVLQEIPKSCAWKIHRFGKSISTKLIESETFGENVGLLTSEVFGLEVEQSGFHDLLMKSVDSSKSYEEIILEYNGQLGFEARSILRSLVADRDRRKKIDSTS